MSHNPPDNKQLLLFVEEAYRAGHDDGHTSALASMTESRDYGITRDEYIAKFKLQNNIVDEEVCPTCHGDCKVVYDQHGPLEERLTCNGTGKITKE